MDRLRTLDAELAERVARMQDSAIRRRLARGAAAAVADRVSIATDPVVQQALQGDDGAVSGADRKALSDLVDRLDEAAWNEQDAGNDEQYVAIFSQARAVNAVLESVAPSPDGNLADVLYEVHAATGDLAFTRALVASADS